MRVSYPGVWLDDGVWATHGHYLDRHLMPESSVGILRGLFGRQPPDGARPIDYERVAASVADADLAVAAEAGWRSC